MDYPNHTLTHPPKWDEPEAVEIIVYLSGQVEAGGSTAVVPRAGSDDEAYLPPLVHSPGIGDIPWINDRSQAESWFLRNKPEVAKLRNGRYRREKYTKHKKALSSSTATTFGTGAHRCTEKRCDLPKT